MPMKVGAGDNFKDRYRMEFLPHLLIEGLIVSSYALGSKATYIYIPG